MKLDSNRIWDKVWQSVRHLVLETTSSSVTTSIWDEAWVLVRRTTRSEVLVLIERSLDISINRLNEN